MSAKVFYSYAHEDEDLRNKLETHLAILRRNGVISEWHDRRILAGAKWSQAIDDHVNTSDLILLLISPDFLASDYCHDIEMKRAMERHAAGEAMVIPVILRPVDWQGALFSQLQALPKDAKPITTWQNLDEAFTDVARGIRKAIEAPGQANHNKAAGPNLQVKAMRLLEGAAPTRIPVGHSRFVVGKISIEGSPGLRGELNGDETYAIESTNVKAQQFYIGFPVVGDAAHPVNALVRLKSPDFEPKHQEIHVELSPHNDSIILPFHVKAGQTGSKFVTLEVLLENQFVVSRALRTEADDSNPPGSGGTSAGIDPTTPSNWSVVALLALSVLAHAEAQRYREA